MPTMRTATFWALGTFLAAAPVLADSGAPAPPPTVAPAPAPRRGPSMGALSLAGAGPVRATVRYAEPDPLYTPDPPLTRAQRARCTRAVVQVAVLVDVDGTPTPRLQESTGNVEVDNLIVNALKTWRWRPALRESVPTRLQTTLRYSLPVVD